MPTEPAQENRIKISKSMHDYMVFWEIARLYIHLSIGGLGKISSVHGCVAGRIQCHPSRSRGELAWNSSEGVCYVITLV